MASSGYCAPAHRGATCPEALVQSLSGIESAYVLEGGLELPIQGQPTRTIKPGDGFQIPPETPHAGGKPAETKTRILITYVVEKGKPLASPA
jgi:quercetin dioxygenase-like cupin family protein